MCQRVTCSWCEKPTFAGCGRHVEHVLGDVPRSDRCHCHESPDGPRTTATSGERGWIKSIKEWLT